jgi:16S rRNA (guanine527-N7)-methyltransferase
MDIVEFWTICSANGIVLEAQQLESIARYKKELLYWNERVNLVSRKEDENMLWVQILHSLAPLKYLEIPLKAKCIDIGTGGGLPGIPIAIARNDLRIMLVDSIAKKMKITAMLAKHTGSRFLESKTARVEDLADDEFYQSRFDFAFARAVAKIEIVLGWIRKIMKPAAKVIFYKGGDLNDEITKAKDNFANLHAGVIPISLMGCDWFVEQDKKLVVCSFQGKS